MNRHWLLACGIIVLVSASVHTASSGTVASPTRAAARPSTLPSDELSVLTYNVEGLPWPIAFDRPSALARIGNRLNQLRASGTAPEIVVLQEAFTPEARAIARRAGYPYVAFGPTASTPRPFVDGIARDPDPWKGEGFSPILSSGLVIMSDYRLSNIRSSPFPAGACSGYDCLANKGILSARVAVPGTPDPVEIVTTHFNSGNPSGQPEGVSRVAYRLQMEALNDFTSDAERKPTIRIYAGDFNIGHSPGRLSILAGYIRDKRAKIAYAMGREKYAGLCENSDQHCLARLMNAANVPLIHANDWQFFAVPRDVSLVPIAKEEMFRPDGEGKRLSDHLGLKVTYRFH
ncbi:MAG: endonuclease/exonuclease/phosphatase family protein [Sphingobium sp.]